MDEKKNNGMNPAVPNLDYKEGFLSGSHIAFVFKKVERLGTAIYLISNLWNDNEPLKWKLRDRNLCLLEDASRYHYSHQFDRSRIGQQLVARIVEIVSELEIAFATGLLSEMNLRVLKEEYLYLIKLVEEKDAGFVTLPKKFFEALSETAEHLKERNLPEGRSDTAPENRVETKANDYKGHKGHEPKTMSFSKSPAKPAPKPAAKSADDERRGTILALVRARGEITVKDAVSVIKGVSEKTIQRELLSMTAAGLLRKSGERRWSKYSLK